MYKFLIFYFYLFNILFLVIPVAVALMTPIPLLMAFLIKKCFGKNEGIVENPDPAAESMLKNKDDIAVPTPTSQNEIERP